MAGSRVYLELDEELYTRFWYDKAQSIWADKLSVAEKLNGNRAKNVILRLGNETIASTCADKGDTRISPHSLQ